MTAQLGPKEHEVMTFLHENVFDVILDSPTASKEVKAGVRQTIMRMERLPAAKMVQFYWSAVKGTDRSIKFAELMRREKFLRFEDPEVLEKFRVRFGDAFLRQLSNRL